MPRHFRAWSGDQKRVARADRNTAGTVEPSGLPVLAALPMLDVAAGVLTTYELASTAAAGVELFRTRIAQKVPWEQPEDHRRARSSFPEVQ